jgi:hypothetical protein
VKRTSTLDTSVPSQADYVVMTVECSHCKTKQNVHAQTGIKLAQMSYQAVQCIQYNSFFRATVPYKVLRGPFPVEYQALRDRPKKT